MTKRTFLSLLTLGVALLSWAPCAFSEKFKVLVVMSYEENYPWVMEIRQGIEPLLLDQSQIQYFYLNTKTNWEGGAGRAKKAYALYQRIKPDGVIVADDDAQSMFVIPYLKDKVPIPVVFCGVNAEACEYGYPASNVTGVLEREPMKQSLLLLKQLVPSVKTFGLISKNSPTDKAVQRQLNTEKELYPIEYIGSRAVQSMQAAIAAVEQFESECDALLYITLEGLPDKDGKQLTDREIMPVLVKTFGKPVITNAMYRVKYGALSAVVKTGQEHGKIAAEMLLALMRGAPISKNPITQNQFGQRIINVDAMVALGIRPKPLLIRSATLVRTER